MPAIAFISSIIRKAKVSALFLIIDYLSKFVVKDVYLKEIKDWRLSDKET
jgi:hypothetical protein